MNNMAFNFKNTRNIIYKYTKTVVIHLFHVHRSDTYTIHTPTLRVNFQAFPTKRCFVISLTNFRNIYPKRRYHKYRTIYTIIYITMHC